MYIINTDTRIPTNFEHKKHEENYTIKRNKLNPKQAERRE
jgi:hypothetical protein